MIEWKEEYSTGILDIDTQHKVLFRYINELEDLIRAGSKSTAHVANMVSFLEGYCKLHFNHEEKCMAERHCSAAHENKEAHRKFLEAFLKMKSRFDIEGSDEGFVKDLHKMVEDWIVSHICKVDVKLRYCPSH